MTSLFTRLAAQNAEGRFLCVGLDPDVAHARKVIRPNLGFGRSNSNVDDDNYFYPYVQQIIRASGPHAACFKFNFEFWAEGGLEPLKAFLTQIKREFPATPIILDRKFGDIGNTSARSAQFVKKLGFDYVTVNPYMGLRDIVPAFAGAGIGCFVLARTSNKAAADLQSCTINVPGRVGIPPTLSEHVIEQVRNYGTHCLGLVVGATDTLELAKLKAEAGDAPMLIPGMGAQGGTPEEIAALMADYAGPWVANASRGVAEASDDPEAWAEAVGTAARTFNESLAAR